MTTAAYRRRIERLVKRLEREADHCFAEMDSEDTDGEAPEVVRLGVLMVEKRAIANELRLILKEDLCRRQK